MPERAPCSLHLFAKPSSLRAALYMGAFVASRFNPVIRGFYQRLLAVGERRRLALTACMLKHCSPWCDLTPKVAGHSS